jgi:hypothetical protein
MEQADPSAPLREQLGPGEHLLWTGRPQRGIRFGAGDLFMVPLGLLWGGFAIYWEWSVIQSRAPLLLRLWGIPFVAIGLYLIAGRFLWDAYQRRHTHYGVTNERVLVVTTGLRSRVRSRDLRTLGEMTPSSGADGPGSRALGTTPGGVPRWLAASGWPGLGSALPGFESIEELRRVQDVIRQAQQAARSRTRDV